MELPHVWSGRRQYDPTKYCILSIKAAVWCCIRVKDHHSITFSPLSFGICGTVCIFFFIIVPQICLWIADKIFKHSSKRQMSKYTLFSTAPIYIFFLSTYNPTNNSCYSCQIWVSIFFFLFTSRYVANFKLIFVSYMANVENV